MIVLCIRQNFSSSLSFLFPLALPVQRLKYPLRSSVLRGGHRAQVHCEQSVGPCGQEERQAQQNSTGYHLAANGFWGLPPEDKGPRTAGSSGCVGDGRAPGGMRGASVASWTAACSAAESFGVRLPGGNLLRGHRRQDPSPPSKHTEQRVIVQEVTDLNLKLWVSDNNSHAFCSLEDQKTWARLWGLPVL